MHCDQQCIFLCQERRTIMRKTKIVCTLGPASSTKEVIIGLCKAGMNVARFNFSHGTHEQHKRDMDIVKKVRQELNMPIAIMLDTKGPEIRLRTFEEENYNITKTGNYKTADKQKTKDKHRITKRIFFMVVMFF